MSRFFARGSSAPRSKENSARYGSSPRMGTGSNSLIRSAKFSSAMPGSPAAWLMMMPVMGISAWRPGQGQQGVVDAAQGRAADHQRRQVQIADQVFHQVAGAERHHQSPGAFHQGEAVLAEVKIDGLQEIFPADHFSLPSGRQQRRQRFVKPEGDNLGKGFKQVGGFFDPGAVGIPGKCFPVGNAAFHRLQVAEPMFHPGPQSHGQDG